MSTSMVSCEDINYLAQQSTSNLNMILSGMTALLNDNNSKVAMLENQTWFQRMCRTVSGKNKMTQQEIQRNHDKINAYMTQAMTELYEQQCIDRQIMMSLGHQLNELYAEQLRLKQMLGAFVSKLNEKIESIDNFHMLNTEIEQGIYSDSVPIVAVCKILSQMDKRCMQDYRKMNILRRSMSSQNILGGEQLSLANYLIGIAEIPMDEAGQIYLELSSLRGNFMANIILNMMENYHFLPDVARKMKNKQQLVQSVIQSEQLDSDMMLSIDEVYDDFVNSKLDMLEGLLPISAIQYDSKLEEAEILFLDYKLDEAFEIFKTLAEKGNGRAMYYMGEYYAHPYGKIEQDDDKAKEWRMKGQDAGDILSTLNVAYNLDRDDDSREGIFKKVFDQVLELAENGDVIAQNELADMYESGYGIEESMDESFRWLKSSAEQGYWRSQQKLGLYYATEKGDYEKALEWWHKAADKGYYLAMRNIANCYYDGKGVEKNDTKKVEWYLKAEKAGDVYVLYKLGYSYDLGEGVAEDKDKAIEWYLKSIQAGEECGRSTQNIGVIYCNRNEYAEGERWLKRAVEEYGFGYAAINLAVINSNRPEEREMWYEKAARLGKGDTQVNKALTERGIKLFENGDYQEAVKYFRWAAENGYADAQNRLGVRYYNGQGVSEDKIKAYEWFKKAADQGHVKALENLGNCYSEN